MAGLFDWITSAASGSGGGFSDVLQGFGAGFAAMGAYSSADSQKAMYAYQAQLARNNAIVQEQRAKDALARGATNVQNVQMKTAQVKSDQRAALAANGIDLGSGSAVDILTTTDYMGARDAITAQHNADMEAWADRNNANNLNSDAALYDKSSDSVSPFMSFGSSLLTSATQYADRYYAMNTAKGKTPTTSYGNTSFWLGSK